MHILVYFAFPRFLFIDLSGFIVQLWLERPFPDLYCVDGDVNLLTHFLKLW